MSPTVPCHVMVCRRRCVLCHAPCTCIVARLIPYKRVVACVRISGRVSASECQALGDKLLGAALMAFSAALFVYYTAWTVVTVRLSGIEAICIVMGVHRARLKGWLSRPLLPPPPPPVAQPFLPPSHDLQRFFIDRWYAVAIPAGLIVLLLVFVSTFILSVLRKAAAAKKAK